MYHRSSDQRKIQTLRGTPGGLGEVSRWLGRHCPLLSALLLRVASNFPIDATTKTSFQFASQRGMTLVRQARGLTQ